MPKVEKAKKVQQQKQQEKQLHPNSRRAAKLTKVFHRDEKLQRRKEEHDNKSTALRDKLCWFKSQLEEDKDKYSLVEVSDMITKYINRFGERLKEIKDQNEFNKEKGRHGRFCASEEEAMKMVFEREQDAFITGKFEAPDLTNRVNVKKMKKWEGETKDILNLKLRNFKDQALLNLQNKEESDKIISEEEQDEEEQDKETMESDSTE